MQPPEEGDAGRLGVQVSVPATTGLSVCGLWEQLCGFDMLGVTGLLGSKTDHEVLSGGTWHQARACQGLACSLGGVHS